MPGGGPAAQQGQEHMHLGKRPQCHVPNRRTFTLENVRRGVECRGHLAIRWDVLFMEMTHEPDAQSPKRPLEIRAVPSCTGVVAVRADCFRDTMPSSASAISATDRANGPT
jgi:hypothetical protein